MSSLLNQAMALLHNCQLSSHFQVGRNNISDAGAEMAVDLLKRMPHINLKCLDLSVS